MQSCVHSFYFLFIFYFLPDRPTHLHEREDDGKGNILLGLPNQEVADSRMLRNSLTSLSPIPFKGC